MSKVAINLVNFNGEKYLTDCLNSVFQQTFKDFSLLVINNASQDNSVNLIKEKFPQAKIVESKKNLGFAKGQNQAIHWTDSQYVLCLNQDVILEPDFLEKAVKFIDEHKEVGSLSPKLYFWDFNQQKKTNIIDSVGLKIFKNHRFIDMGQGEKDTFFQTKEIFGPSGAAPIYRREALEQIKINQEYFDEDFFMYKEDVDLAYRLQHKGWKSYFIPEVIAYHYRVNKSRGDLSDKTTFTNRNLKTRFSNYQSYRNHLFVLLKNEFLSNLTIFFPRIFWYELKKFIYLLFFERQTLSGILDFFAKLTKILGKRRTILKTSHLSAKELRKWYF